jgi:hypothetical protein
MTQLALIFDAPPAPAFTVHHARAEGERLGNLAADKAEEERAGFRAAAEAFVLAYLQQHGPSSGEGQARVRPGVSGAGRQEADPLPAL